MHEYISRTFPGRTERQRTPYLIVHIDCRRMDMEPSSLSIFPCDNVKYLIWHRSCFAFKHKEQKFLESRMRPNEAGVVSKSTACPPDKPTRWRTREMGSFVIQYSANPSFCIGVQGTPAEGSVVTLVPINSPNVTWIMNPSTGLITPAKAQSLVLSVEGTIANLVQLSLQTVKEISLAQRWNWLNNQPYIVLQEDSGFCIDNRGGVQEEGNPIQLWQVLPNDVNQQWTIVNA